MAGAPGNGDNRPMKTYIGTLDTGEAIAYVDRKRYLWILSVLFPLQPLTGVYLHYVTGNEAWIFFGILMTYALGPLLDWLLGEDENNPPEEVVMQLERDKYYRRLTYAIIPLHIGALIGSAWYASSAGLAWWSYLGLAMVAGMTAGLAINTGHELGHKNSRIEKWLARLVLAVPAYGHFSIDHNRGHHRDVSTPEDPASAQPTTRSKRRSN